MAQKVDGSVYINTKIDNSGIKAGAKEIQSGIRRIVGKISQIGSKMKNSMQELVNFSQPKFDIKEYETVKKEVSSLTSKLDKAIEKQIKFMATGGKEGSPAFQKMEYDIENISAALTEAQKKKDAFEANGAGQKTSPLFTNLKTAIGELGKSNLKILSPIETLKSELGRLSAEIKTKLAGVGAAIINGLAHPFSTLKKAAIPALERLSKAAKKAAKEIAGKLLSGIKKLSTAILGLNKSTKKSNKSLGTSFKNILRYGFGIRSVFFLFNRLRNALMEGVGNLAQFSSDANKSLSGIKSSLTQIKNSAATAFAPLITVVAPALTQFIALISKALTYFGAFISALTGKSTFVKAVAVQEDYAASLEGTANAAKDAKKATNGYLSGLDEIQRYDEPDKSGSGSLGGGISPQDMFTTEQLPSTFTDFAEKVKEAWKNADFTELGGIVGEKIRTALDDITWEGIKEKCNKIAFSVATFINGFVHTPGIWTKIGSTIGEGLNTAVGAWNTFFDTTNFEKIGSGIAEGLNSIFDTVNPTDLGRSLTQLIRAGIESLYGFVTDFEWDDFGTWIGDLLNGALNNIPWDTLGQTLGKGLMGALSSIKNFAFTFDWKGLGTDISNAINGFFAKFDGKELASTANAIINGLASTLLTVVKTTDWEAVWKDIIDFLFSIDWLGNIKKGLEIAKELIAGLFSGLINAVRDTDWKKIWNDFVQAFKDFFGIHSPSTLMAEQGGLLISGVLQGLKDKFTKVIDWLAGLPEKFKSYFLQAKNKITETFDNIGAWFKDKFENAKNSIKTAFSSVGEFFSDIWAGIKNTFSNVGNWFRDKFSDAWTKVKNVFSTGGKIFDGIKNGILSGLKTVVNGIIKGINKVVSVPFNGLNNTLAKLKKIDILGVKPFGWVSTFKVPQIPYLAKGAVIPPNAPFMAMLGDQRRGTNIETPENLLRKIVREESSGKGIDGNIELKVYLSGRQIYEEVMRIADLVRAQSGRNPYEAV